MNPTTTSRSGIVAAQRPQLGLSLIELMIAITLGMLVVAALLALFLNITRTNSEMAKSNRLIENGRFAIQLLQSDLSHAGFWGDLDFSIVPAPSFAAPTGIPDPCDVNISGGTQANKDNLLSIPIQGYANGSTLAGCGVSGVLASSDVLVVRHANTCTAGSTCDGGSDTGPHIQVSSCRSGTPPEAMYVIDSATFPLMEKDCATPAEQRKFVSNIYYLGTSNGQPTLMRVRLVNGAYASSEPLIEGIEAMRFEYGIDSTGDGSPDSYVSAPPTAPADLANIVAVKVHVLARNLEVTPGYTDSKSYQLGVAAFTVPTTDTGFKRHVFSTTVRLVNPSGRREVP